MRLKTWATAQFDYRLRQSERFTLATGLKVRYVDNLTADEQLLAVATPGYAAIRAAINRAT